MHFKTKKWIDNCQSRLGIIDLKSWLYDQYVNELKTVRQLEKMMGAGSNRTVLKLLRVFNIPIRHGSEAIKVQWIDNDERRKKLAEQTKRLLSGKPAWNRGLTVRTGDKLALWLSKTRKGSGNPQFIHDRTDEERVKLRRDRKDTGYTSWRISIYRRDHFTCQICGNKSSGNLVAHHLDSYTYNEELRLQINNGITLCKYCHKEFHKIYGNKRNTAEQFSEFYLFKTGKQYSPIYQLALF